MSTFFPTSTVIKTLTLTDDEAHHIANSDIPFYNCDFQCKTNTIVIGLGGVFDFVLNPGETYYTKHANLRDFMIKNSTAGNNGVVTIIATVPNKFIKENLGGIL